LGRQAGRSHAAFAEQIKALVEAVWDAILMETFSDLMELLEALSAAHEVAQKHLSSPI